jgi:hypothetical protein
MTRANPPLPIGYSPVPPGQVANVATFLDMKSRPIDRMLPISAPGLSVRRWQAPELAAYRALFKTIGENWMWY